MYGSDDEQDDAPRRYIRKFPNFHHGAPLTYFPQRHIVNLYGGLSNVKAIPLFGRVLKVIDHMNRIKHVSHILTDDPTRFYTRMFSAALTDGCPPMTDKSYICLRNGIVICVNEIRTDLTALQEWHPGLQNISRVLNLTPQHVEQIVSQLGLAYKTLRELNYLRNRIQIQHVAGRSEDGSLVGSTEDFVIHSVNEILLILDNRMPGKILLINYDQLLMVVDTYSCRFMCRLACLINEIIGLDDLPTHDLLRTIYRWGDSILQGHGVSAYALIGEFETIVTNAFVNYPESDPLGLGVPFHDAMIETAEEIEKEYGIPAGYARQLAQILKRAPTPNTLSEIFGLRRHWGNPMVEADASGRAVQEKVNELLPIHGSSVVKLQASFNRMITLEYIKKNGKWPDCWFPESACHTTLFKCWDERITRIPEGSPMHNHFHWALMRFLPNCTIDPFVDQMSLLSDKSVSLYKSNLDALYIRALHPPSLFINAPENRRLMLEFLRRSHLTVLDIFWLIMSKVTPEEWLCNSSSMKGTEMKHKKARIFAVLTFELRQYFAVTENLIKDHIFRYNPHQTMTMKEGELLERLRDFTKQLSEASTERYLNVLHIIDFSKWNLRMRYENTCTVFKSIDDFLGTPCLIESSHLIFEDMLNLVNDPFNPPVGKVAECLGDTIWCLHTGGWEGQRQKGWTVITSALLSYISVSTGIHSEICGQGDNQVLLTKFPVPSQYRNAKDWLDKERDEVRSVLDSFYRVLETECLSVGLKIKTAETCRSLHYLNYGKRLYFNGVELSMTLKRISKMLTEPNDTYPTTESRLKTMEGSIYAAGLYGHPSIVPYLMSRLGVYLTLDETFEANPLIGSAAFQCFQRFGIQYNSRFLSTIMKLPASLGGPPQQLLPAYLCRGHPDPLCSDLVIIKARSDNNDLVSSRILHLALQGEMFGPVSRNYESLIAAPYSLNLIVPTSAKKPLERRVQSHVGGYCRNPDVKELFSSRMDEFSRSLISGLASMRPFHPLIANDVYARSPPGRRDAFISGVTNTTSLSRLVTESRNVPIITSVAQLELAQLEYWVHIYRLIIGAQACLDTKHMSHHSIAQQLREMSWGIQITGVTVPHPLEQFCLTRSDSDLCTAVCASQLLEHIVFIQHNESIVEIPGNDGRWLANTRSVSSSPYLGSTVSEGMSQIDVHCENPNNSWLDLVRLNAVRRWISTPGSDLDLLMKSLIHIRSDIPLGILDRATGRPSRLSYSHRAALMATIRSCAPCTTSNVLSRFYVSSNRMGIYSHGEANYHMAFGPAFLIGMSLLALNAVVERDVDWTSVSRRRIWHFHVRGGAQVPQVYDGAIDLTQHHILPSVSIPRLLFVLSDEVRLIDSTGKSVSDLWSRIEDATKMECQIMYGHQLIGFSFINEMVHHELAQTEVMAHYPPRTASISIGDVSIIGVRNICRCLAMNCLYFAPPRLLTMSSDGLAEFKFTQFLGTFSKSFWNSFVGPLSHRRILQRLVMLSPNHISAYSTRRSDQVVGMLIAAVVREMRYLWADIKCRCVGKVGRPTFLVTAPSLPALRAVYAHYFQIAFLTQMEFKKPEVPNHEFMANARDIVANLHAVGQNNFTYAVQLCKEDFCQRLKHLTRSENITFPEPLLYFLREPWLDEIRDGIDLDTDTELCAVDRPLGDIDPTFVIHEEIIFPEYVTYITGEDCRCPDPPRSLSLHTQCMFSTSGLLSKSHLKFMEIILAFQLDVRGVICLGSGTGTEAAALSRIIQCQKVYVNCLQLVHNFSPHCMGSYIPPAFLTEGIPHKLLRPEASAVSTNDLLEGETVNRIVEHVGDVCMTGITCDAELPIRSTKDDFLKLISNLITLIQMMTWVQWLIIKLPISCPHQGQSYTAVLSRAFYRCHVIYSSFNRQNSNNFHLCCTGRRPSISGSFSTDKVILSDSESFMWGKAVHYVQNMVAAPSFILNRKAMKIKCSSCNVLSSSFTTACHQYLPGWGSQYNGVPSITLVKEDLVEIRRELHMRIMERVRAAYRVSSCLPMLRSGVLQQTTTSLTREINGIAQLVFRSALLTDILELEVRTYDSVISLVSKFLSSNFSVRIRGFEYYVRVDIHRFTNVTSRYLFEILGHILGHDTMRFTQVPILVLHRTDPPPHFIEADIEPMLRVKLSPLAQRPNRLWAWPARCYVLSLLLITWKYPYYRVRTDSPFEYLDQQKIEDLLIKTAQSEATRQTHPIPYVWMPEGSSIHSLQLLPGYKAFICMPVYRFADLGCHLEFEWSLIPPWSGVVASRILVLATPRVEVQSSYPHPDILYHSQLTNQSGMRFCNCACTSCVVEEMLCDQLSISHSTIDSIVSVGRPDSVLSTYH